MMKGVVFSLLGLILLMCACGSSKTKQERGKATVQADTVKSYQGELSIIYPSFVPQNNRIYSESPLRLFYPYSLRVFHFSKSTSLSSSFIPKPNLYSIVNFMALFYDM